MVGSRSYQNFRNNVENLQRLSAIHKYVTANKRGPHHKLDSINRSIVVLSSAYWQAYVEDVILEVTDILLTNSNDPEVFGEGIRKAVAERLTRNKGYLQYWNLAGDNWKDKIKEEINAKTSDRSEISTPKAYNIDQFSKKIIGVSLKDFWYWRNMSRSKAAHKLDTIVDARNKIAHGRTPTIYLDVSRARDCQNHIERLVYRTEKGLSNHLVRHYNLCFDCSNA